jgi:ABC-type amino acid transport substrate-binding protein
MNNIQFLVPGDHCCSNMTMRIIVPIFMPFLQSRNLKRFVFYLLIMFLFIAAGCRQESASWQRVQAAGILRVGLDPTFPPFEAFDGQSLYGLDVDLAQGIAQGLDLEVEFVHFGYDGLYDALATDQVDVLISALVIVPERTRDFAYSDSYFNAGQILISNKMSPIEDPEELNGQSVAVELGAQGHVIATSWQRQMADLTIQTYPSTSDALAAVVSGQATAALTDSVSGRLFVDQSTELQISQDPVTNEPYAMVVNIESEELLSKLNDSLELLNESNELQRITNRWLSS